MKIISLLFVMLFISCNLWDMNVIRDRDITEGITNKELYYDERFEEIEPTFKAISMWINRNVEYEYNDIYFANPKATIERGKGSCDEKALLFINMAYFIMGIKMDIIATYIRHIGEGGEVNHAAAAILYDGIVYEPVTGLPVDYTINYYYYFDEIFTKGGL